MEISYNDTVQSSLNTSDVTVYEYVGSRENIEPVHQRTIQEIMAESDISIHNSNDEQTESKHQSSEADISFSLAINHGERNGIFSDNEISIERYENELATMKAKSKNIEEMVEKYLLEH